MNKLKFSEMQYVRPDMDKMRAELGEIVASLAGAKDYETARGAFFRYESLNASFATMMNLAKLRYEHNTNDPFYAGEMQFFAKEGPSLMSYMQQWKLALYKSPFRKEFEAEFGQMMFNNLEDLLHSFSPKNVPLMQQEGALKQQYTGLMANAAVEQDGKKLGPAGIAELKLSTDAAVREKIYAAEGGVYDAFAPKLDEIYDGLVHTRTEMAKNMGYPNYIPMGYYRMGRAYGPQDVASFRNAVAKHVVPLLAREYERKAKRLGVPYPYAFSDQPVTFPDGNAKPVGDTAQILENGRAFFHSLSSEAGEFYDMMLERELLNVEGGPGRAPGAHTESLPDFEAPFVFADFSGNYGDVQVLVHEMGHAFAGWVNRERRPLEYIIPTMDAAEIHSFGMEFMADEKAELFFGKDAAKYVYGHLLNALERIAYGCAVDEFQHIVYAEPDMAPAARLEVWKRLLGTYMPWIDTDRPIPFYKDGRSWQLQRHIYASPFYYIDYCLAQICALQLWSQIRTDRKGAWERYLKFAKLGGTMRFTDLITTAGFDSPFEEATIEKICAEADEWIASSGADL